MRAALVIAAALALAACNISPNEPLFGEPESVASNKAYPEARDCVVNIMVAEHGNLSQMTTSTRTIVISAAPNGKALVRVEVAPEGARSRITFHSMGMMQVRLRSSFESCR